MPPPPISANSNRPSAGAKTGSRVFPFLSLGGESVQVFLFGKTFESLVKPNRFTYFGKKGEKSK